MKKFVKYDPASGQILFCGEVPEEMIELQGENLWLGEAHPLCDYILAGEKAARPAMAVTPNSDRVLADGADELVLTGVPAGTEVRITGPVPMDGITEFDGDVTLTFALAGAYLITLDRFPYQSMEVRVNAT